MSHAPKTLFVFIFFTLLNSSLIFAALIKKDLSAPSSQAPVSTDKTKSDDRTYGPGPRGNVPLQNPAPKPIPVAVIDPWETFYQNSTHEIGPINQYASPGGQVMNWSCPVGYRCELNPYGSPNNPISRGPAIARPRCVIRRDYFDRHEAGVCSANWYDYDCRNDPAGCRVGTTASS